MKKIYALLLALCLFVTILPAAAEDGTSAEGEAAGFPAELTPEPTLTPEPGPEPTETPELTATPEPTATPELTATPAPTPVPVKTEFTWKNTRAEVTFMTTDTEPFGLGDLGGGMLLVRIQCRNAEGFGHGYGARPHTAVF